MGAHCGGPTVGAHGNTARFALTMFLYGGPLWGPTVEAHGNTSGFALLMFSYGGPQWGPTGIPAKIHFLLIFYGGPHGGPWNTARAANFDLNSLFPKT